MDTPSMFQDSSLQPIQCIEMHTTGEPTRIIYKGYPALTGTLLEQRAQAKQDHDHIRTRLMLEPRGHADMYGAILRPETEFTSSGEAHMGVLFMTNHEYSTMCGHATIALGRFLVDCHDSSIFPQRRNLVHDPTTNTTLLRLHAPCGLLEVTVPTTADGSKADAARPVSFISVPSFATAIGVNITFDQSSTNASIPVDFCYGGAFFGIVASTSLPHACTDDLAQIDFAKMNTSTKTLKASINSRADLRPCFSHPDSPDLSFLYSIIVTDQSTAGNNNNDAETGLCYFSDQQIDRSPTGSGVAARAALAYAKGDLEVGQSRSYHSLVSRATTATTKGLNNSGSFTGTVVEECGTTSTGYPMVKVRIEGYAYYTGYHCFVVERQDPLGNNGFLFEKLVAVLD